MKTRAGRPPIPMELRELIRRMARENVLWGEERIANELLEHGTRRLAHVNVTTHPSTSWTLQQLREVIGDAESHKYLIHDRDAIFAKHLDNSIRALGLAVLRSPFSSPKANSICERVIGTVRRECLDWMLPMSEAHLRSILREWVTYYNGGRPHSAGSWGAGPSA